MRKAADATDCWPATTQTHYAASGQAADSRGPAGPPAVAAGFWLDDELQAAPVLAHGQGHPGLPPAPAPRPAWLTQDVAGWAGISQGQLSDIERGAPINDLDRLISWALLLGIPEQFLWFKLPGSGPSGEPAGITSADDPHPEIRDPAGALHESSLAAERAAALGVDLWDLLDALEATRISDTSLALAEEACTRLDVRYAELPPTVLPRSCGRQLDHVVAWLKQSQPVSHRQRLSTLASRPAGLRAWLYFDMAEMAAASAWFAAAVRAAQEAENHDLCGYLLGGAEPDPRRPRTTAPSHLLEGGQEHAKRGSDTTRAWLDILEARSRAANGDGQGYGTAYRYAEKRLQRTTTDERRHGMDFAGGHPISPTTRASATSLLRQPLQATEAFHTALDALPSNRAKARAILLLSLAIALAQGNELDHAVGTATEALTIGGDQPIGRVRRSGLANSAGSSARPPAATSCGTWTSNCTPSRGTLERAIAGPVA